MSEEQRARIDAMMRQPHPAGPRPVEELRAGFMALMERMNVPGGIRTTPVALGGRPALHVEPGKAGETGETGDTTETGEPAGPAAGPGGAAPAGTILYFHGGGWVFGSPETAMSLTGHLVARTGLAAYSVDYRLAPEHPFPAAIEDTLAAYRALLDGGTDPSAIVFAGDSAGGGLAVTTCLAARDAGLPLPAGLVAFSPGLDATRTGESMETKEGVDPIFTRAAVEHTGAMYLAGADPHQPLLSPAVLADLTGFPPMLLQVGTNEILLDDSTRLASRARAAGVDVILDVTARVPHVFQSFAGILDEADEALDRAALFLRQRVRTASAARAAAE
ncbi:alpha/beta hydrolase [Streptomyces montanisoli]|uniref:Alpha/beta hydrolase n=1 Tax=Streptomyces montanisoli TaxID=2798581 RepID=A0A940RVW1_9ACTN|nr:alpha/beta hydrolase [Streptomyces montanisoli]MBP0456024.1 alpha/beta hydrolase [Streptomyces montanisoli]